MTERLVRIIPLYDHGASRRILEVQDPGSVATAQALDWPGVLLEAGRNDVAEADDITLGHHYLGLNADDGPITLEVKERGRYRRVTIPPGSGWFTPAGDGFSLRVRCARPHAYVRLSIDPFRFDRLVATSDAPDAPVSLRRRYDVGGPQLGHVVAALTAEARAGTPAGLAFVDTLTAGIALQLVSQAGTERAPRHQLRGGLAPAVRCRILELMDARAEAQLTLETLAREAGLSIAHFARAFRASTGRAPHQHLLALRLERARRLLERSDVSLSQAAARSGFADQAHFTRLFKRQFGVTPGAFVRSRAR